MPALPYRLRRARILLALAALLVTIAQFFPWERAPVLIGGIDLIVGVPITLGPFGTAGNRLSPIHSTWHFELTDHSGLSSKPLTSVDLPSASISHTLIDQPTFLPEVEIYQAGELWIFAKALAEAGSLSLWQNWGTLYLFVCLLAFTAILAMPFLAGPLSRARPILWLTRLCACSLFACLIRSVVLILPDHPGPALDRIGSGYWLTMAALALEITALFLIPDSRKNQLLQSQ